MEEFCLGPLLSGDELDVVDQHDVHSSEASPEFVHPFIPDRIDQFVGKILRGEITDGGWLWDDILLEKVISNGMKKVCLPQSDTTVYEKGIVVFSGKVGDSQTGCIRKLVAWSNDKVLKCVFWTEW